MRRATEQQDEMQVDDASGNNEPGLGNEQQDDPHIPLLVGAVLFLVFFITATSEELRWMGFVSELRFTLQSICNRGYHLVGCGPGHARVVRRSGRGKATAKGITNMNRTEAARKK